MGNQQGKADEREIAWLAGFIDGEGCLDLRGRYDVHRIMNVTPRFRVTNTHVATLNYATNILDRMGLAYYVEWRTPKNPRYKKSWTITILGFKRLLSLLIQITPYLFTKKIRAEKFIDFLNWRLATPYKQHAPAEVERHLQTLSRTLTD